MQIVIQKSKLNITLNKQPKREITNMPQQLFARIKTRQFQIYNDHFNFFLSNSINKILTSKKISQVISFRDMEFLHNQTQYLKRTYLQNEAYNRIKKLINYYEKNMTPSTSILLTVEQYKYLETRKRKILKLQIMKEKSYAKAQVQEQKQKEMQKDIQKRQLSINSNRQKCNNSSLSDFLPKLYETNLQDIIDGERNENQQQYDTEVHDVYQNYKEKARQLFTKDESVRSVSYRDILAIRSIKDSSIVINFRNQNQLLSDSNQGDNEMRNISNSLRGLKFTKNTKVQENVLKQQNTLQQPKQQLYHNQPSENKKLFQNARKNSKQDNEQQQQKKNSYFQYGSSQNVLKNQLSLHHPQLEVLEGWCQVESNISNVANQFTSKISNNNNSSQIKASSNFMNNNYNFPIQSQNTGEDLVKIMSFPPKKKPSFMEYYHSVPVKSPTNLLEKYIKRKK